MKKRRLKKKKKGNSKMHQGRNVEIVWHSTVKTPHKQAAEDCMYLRSIRGKRQQVYFIVGLVSMHEIIDA